MRRGTRSWLALSIAGALLAATGCSSGSGSTATTHTTVATSSTSTTSTSSAANTTASTAVPNTSTPGSATTGTATTGTDATVLPAYINDSKVRAGVLPNGLKYYIRNNDNPGGSAELRLAVDAGSGRQDPDQAGAAHFLEHMMFNGTAKFPKNQLIDVLRASGTKFGADVNAFTTYDETVFQLNVATTTPQPLETGLDVLAQWLSAATLNPDDVTSERGVVLDEWRNREQSSNGRIEDAASAMYLDGSPFVDKSPIGTDKVIEAMTPDLLRRFYDQWYQPANAAVVVVGSINVDNVLAGLTKRFADMKPRSATPLTPPAVVAPSAKPNAAIVSDPDLTKAAVEVTLPTAAVPPSVASTRTEVLDQLAFTMIANRLSDDASKGGQPYDDAYVSSNAVVRSLDAPSVVLDSKPDKVTDSATVLLDEFERAHRYGFDAGELQRAVNAAIATAKSAYDSRDTVQDAAYADEYASSFLTGAPYLNEQDTYDLTTKVLQSIKPADVSAQFNKRWAATAPRVLITAPATATVPSHDDVLAEIAALPKQTIAQRPPTQVVTGQLLAAPAPVTEIKSTALASLPDIYVKPTELTFANGVRVVFNNTPVTAKTAVLFGRSPGGMANVPDASVADATVAVDVVTNSGVGTYDQAELDQRVSATSVKLQMNIAQSTDEMYGSSSAGDLESLFGLIHLYMTAPKVDKVALDNEVTTLRATAADPTADPQSAGFDALNRARYGDDLRFRSVLTGPEIDSVTADGIAKVWADRFGNASDWTFAISGDFDIAAATKLARSYFGTLPGTGAADKSRDIEPAPPAKVVDTTVHAGTGAKAELLRLYSVDVADNVGAHVLADVAAEVVSTKLLQDIREALGESYSPSASFTIMSSPAGGNGHLQVFIDISSSPDQMDPLSKRLSQDITALATTGPSATDVSSAVAVVAQQYGLISNEALCDALLNGELGYGPTTQDSIDRNDALNAVQRKDVIAFLGKTLPMSQYVQVRVVPR